MRIHTVITLYVLLFARFFDFTREDYALLMLTIGGVIALEAVNTAVEVLCDKVSSKEDSYIKHAKDIAAGAVLIAAVVSVVIALFLFGNIEGWLNMYNFYIGNPLRLSALMLSAVVSFVYVFIPPWKWKEH